MLHKCANPACSSLFRSLSRGKLFLLDRDTAPVASGVASANRRKRSGRQFERLLVMQRLFLAPHPDL